MRTLSKREYCYMLQNAEPERFRVTISPWDSVILIDKCWDYYETPKE